VNPVPPTAESLASGADLYRANCSSCHGAHGGGDGPALGEPTRNLAENVPQRTDGELDWIIDRGLAGTRMPGFALTLDEADRWDLINHLRASFGRASRPP
ncbi:MAG TPA: cytochrome c, partial [Candidatus Limnocylindria bacterium]|nr:cytochrome c [Candidatus Limnocylindria bacterium]